MYLTYRTIRRDLRCTPMEGLVRYVFLMEGVRACYTLSIWESDDAIARFGNLVSHVSAARRSKRYCSHVWSAYWQLDALSRHSNSWPGAVQWPELLLHTHPLYPYRLVPGQVERAQVMAKEHSK